MSWIFLFLVLVIVAAILVMVFSSISGRAEKVEPLDSALVRESNEQAIKDGDLDKVVFEVVFRGYRQDQVDAVLAQLIEENERLKKGLMTDA